MAEPTLHGDPRTLSVYGSRSLAKTFPELLDYLSPGSRVLDVGCGPGTITVDVANAVAPGRVDGIDLEEVSVESARGLATERKVDNVSFQVADSYRIPFDDDTFDLTYSHAVFDWLSDPVAALREQTRVTKAGGWICAMMCTQGSAVIYPVFPALQLVFDSWSLLADRSHDLYHDRYVGRRSVELFKTAGLSELTLKPMQQRIWYAKEGESSGGPMIPVMKEFLDPQTQLWWRDRLLALGVLSERIIEQARREYEEWIVHPHALYAQFHILAAGKVGGSPG